MLKSFKTILASVLCVAGISHAQVPEMPAELRGKTVTMVIPFAPGGDTDSNNRFMAEEVKKLTGLEFVYINKPGAKGVIGGRMVAESKPDGLTMFGSSNETFVMNPALEETGYVDPALLTPVVIHAFTPQFFYVGVRSGINTPEDLVKAARENPKFTVGCNAPHQCMYIAQWFDHFGIQPYTVYFGKAPEMAIAAVDTSITMFASGVSTGLPFVQRGELKAIGTTWDRELAVYPGALPLNRQVPKFKANNFQMISVPAATPKHIVEYYNQVFRLAAKTAKSRERFEQMSMIHEDLTLNQLDRYLKQELAQAKRNRKFMNIAK